VSYPRSGSNFLLENLRDYIEITKDPTYEFSNKECIIVLRNPIDAIVSGIVHNHARTETILPEDEYLPTLIGAAQFYVDHLKKYDLPNITVYDFNDLVSNPVGVLRTIADFDGEIVYPTNLKGSLKNHPLYEPLYKYAMQNPEIFTNANKAYLDGLKYKYDII
jgi:hypothetical protein